MGILGNLILNIVGKDSTSQAAASATQNLNKIGKAGKGAGKQVVMGFKQLAGAYNAMVVARHAVGFLGAMIKPAMELEQAQTKMANAAGVSRKEIELLTAAAMEGARITPFGLPEGLEAATELALKFRDVNKVAEFLPTTMAVATTYFNKDLGDATKAVGLFASALGVPASEMEEKLDKWVGSAQALGVQVKDTAGGLKYLGAAILRANTSVEDALPIYELTTKALGDSTQAGNAMKTMTARLVSEKRREILMNRLGIDTLDEMGQQRSLQDLMLDLSKSYELNKGNLSSWQSAATEVFGERGILPILTNIKALSTGISDTSGNIRKGADVYAYVSQAMAKSGGLITEQSAKMALELGNLWDALTMDVKNFAASIGEYVIPYLGTATQMLSAFMSVLTGTIIQLGPIGTALKATAGYLATSGGAYLTLISVALMGKGVFAIIDAALGTVNLSLKKIWLTMTETVRNIINIGRVSITTAGKVGILSKALFFLRMAGGLLLRSGFFVALALLPKAIEGAVWLWDDLFGGKKKKAISPEQRGMLEQEAKQAAAMRLLNSAMEGMAAAAEKLDKAGETWRKIFEKDMPVMPVKARAFLEKGARDIMRLLIPPGEKGAPFRKKFKESIEAISGPEEWARRNRAPTEKEYQKAELGASLIRARMGRLPGAKTEEIKKYFESFMKGMRAPFTVESFEQTKMGVAGGAYTEMEKPLKTTLAIEQGRTEALRKRVRALFQLGAEEEATAEWRKKGGFRAGLLKGEVITEKVPKAGEELINEPKATRLLSQVWGKGPRGKAAMEVYGLLKAQWDREQKMKKNVEELERIHLSTAGLALPESGAYTPYSPGAIYTGTQPIEKGKGKEKEKDPLTKLGEKLDPTLKSLADRTKNKQDMEDAFTNSLNKAKTKGGLPPIKPFWGVWD